MALTEIFPMHASGVSRANPDNYYVAVSITKGTHTDAVSASQTAITVTTAAMTDLRWVVGDRVKILVDPDTNEVHLRRAAHQDRGSFALSPQNVRVAASIGKAVNCQVRTSDLRLPRIPMIRLCKADCYIAADSGDLVFVYPVPLNIPKPEKAPVVAIPAAGQVIGAPHINHRDNQRHVARR